MEIESEEDAFRKGFVMGWLEAKEYKTNYPIDSLEGIGEFAYHGELEGGKYAAPESPYNDV